MDQDNEVILRCEHCGNVAPHTKLLEHNAYFLFAQFKDGDMYEPFDFLIFACNTCNGVIVMGGFRIEIGPNPSPSQYPQLYPNNKGYGKNIPDKISKAYNEACIIRQKAPNAFAGQIRRALEYLCQDQGANGKDLYRQLADLAARGVLPKTLVEMTDLIRKVGNTGVHASDEEVTGWDATLIDEFFRAVVEYVYIAPQKVERLKKYLNKRKPSSPQT